MINAIHTRHTNLVGLGKLAFVNWIVPDRLFIQQRNDDGNDKQECKNVKR